MKKYNLLVLLLIFSLVLSACASATNNAAAQVTGDTANTTQSASLTGGNGDMTLALKLALGTFMLEKTEYPIQAEQAKKLLPLWKAARSLSTSETAAKEDLTALVDQIQATMTAEQMQEIELMDLNFESMQSIADELGLELGQAGSIGNADPQAQATMQAARESGQIPQSGFGDDPGMGDGPGGDQGFNPAAGQTEMAGSGAMPRANLGVNPTLLEAIVQFLQTKAG